MSAKLQLNRSGEGNIKAFFNILGLLGGLLAAVTVIVVPLVWLAVQQPLVFRLLTLIILAVTGGWLLRRKYKTMSGQQRADTRVENRQISFSLKFFLIVVVKPIYWLAVFICFMFVLYTLLHRPLVGVVALLFLAFMFMVLYKRIQRQTGQLD